MGISSALLKVLPFLLMVIFGQKQMQETVKHSWHFNIIKNKLNFHKLTQILGCHQTTQTKFLTCKQSFRSSCHKCMFYYTYPDSSEWLQKSQIKLYRCGYCYMRPTESQSEKAGCVLICNLAFLILPTPLRYLGWD